MESSSSLAITEHSRLAPVLRPWTALRSAYGLLSPGRAPKSSRLFEARAHIQCLKASVQRTGLWMLCMLAGGLVVLVAGTPAPETLRPFEIWHWFAGLCLLAALHFPLARWITGLDSQQLLRWSGRPDLLLNGWILAMSLWWLLALWALKPQPWPDMQQQPGLELGQRLMLFLTFFWQGVASAILSTSRRSVFTALTLGFLVPLVLLINPALLLDEPLVAFPNDMIGLILAVFVMLFAASGCTAAWLFRRSVAATLRAEDSRDEAETRLRQANNFLTSVSHDLRQPLSAIGTLMHNMRTDGARPGDMETIETQVSAMTGIVDSCLDLSLLETGQWKVNIEDLSLPHLFDQVETTCGQKARNRGIELVLPDAPWIVRSDEISLLRILVNLVDNAVKYTPRPDPQLLPAERPRVEVICRQTNDGVLRISVRDQGQGIPVAQQADVTRAFVQLNNPERNRDKGLGMGLSIVNGLTRLLDHQFDFTSQEGVGSEFSVEVPFVGQIPRQYLGGARHAAPRPDFGGMKVVLIEDEHVQRAGMERMLGGLGCHVFAGEDAQEVLDELEAAYIQDWPDEDLTPPDGSGRAYVPDFILSDYRLTGGRTGIGEIGMLHAHYGRRIPGAIWTGDTAPSVLDDIWAAGFTRLTKPIDPDDLIGLLSEARISELS